MPELGRFFILVGVMLVLLGLVLTLAGKVPWLGRLPGDIFYKTDHVTIYFPIMTSLLISIILTLILYLFRR
ncbi:MAG: DUF2905 domain-containing protein [Candidatus Binatia bacterium]|nr:DUF2905 domain-containing protein [Candidatus Binatia bacterium]